MSKEIHSGRIGIIHGGIDVYETVTYVKSPPRLFPKRLWWLLASIFTEQVVEKRTNK